MKLECLRNSMDLVVAFNKSISEVPMDFWQTKTIPWTMQLFGSLGFSIGKVDGYNPENGHVTPKDVRFQPFVFRSLQQMTGSNQKKSFPSSTCMASCISRNCASLHIGEANHLMMMIISIYLYHYHAELVTSRHLDQHPKTMPLSRSEARSNGFRRPKSVPPAGS